MLLKFGLWIYKYIKSFKIQDPSFPEILERTYDGNVTFELKYLPTSLQNLVFKMKNTIMINNWAFEKTKVIN